MNPYFPNLDPTKVNDYFRLGEQFTEAARQFATLDPRAIDPGKLHEAQRKNMDALVEANRRTATECEALFRDHLATLQKAAERTRAQLEAARQAPGAARFVLADGTQANIGPAGKTVLAVPEALAVPAEDQLA